MLTELLKVPVFDGETEEDTAIVVDAVEKDDTVDKLEDVNNEDGLPEAKDETVINGEALAVGLPVCVFESHDDGVFVTVNVKYGEAVLNTVAKALALTSDERVDVVDADRDDSDVGLLIAVKVGDTVTVDDIVLRADCVLPAERVIVWTAVPVLENVDDAVIDEEIDVEKVTVGEPEVLDVRDADAEGVEETVDVRERILDTVAVFDCDFVPLGVVSIDGVDEAQIVDTGEVLLIRDKVLRAVTVGLTEDAAVVDSSAV